MMDMRFAPEDSDMVDAPRWNVRRAVSRKLAETPLLAKSKLLLSYRDKYLFAAAAGDASQHPPRAAPGRAAVRRK
jgi:hypothetical protein